MRACASILAIAVACGGRGGPGAEASPAGDSGGGDDTGGPACAEGEVLADDGECVPDACGTGRWGTVATSEVVAFVDASAEAGGDGSEGSPLQSIQDGLDAAGAAGGGTVAVAQGTYGETLDLDRPHDGVRLAGRCPDLCIIDASGEESGTGIWVVGRRAGFGVSGVTVTGAEYCGVVLLEGELDLGDVRIVRNAVAGVVVDGASTVLSIEDADVSETAADASGRYGYGLQVTGGATVTARRATIASNRIYGVVAGGAGTSVVLDDCEVRETSAVEGRNGGYGYGVDVYGGASAELESCSVIGNHTAGVLITDAGSSLVLRDSEVRDTAPQEDGSFGYGIEVGGGASLVLEGSVVAGNRGIGLDALGAGTSVVLQDAEISGTLPQGDGTAGSGVQASGGAAVSIESSIVSGNTGLGVLAFDDDTSMMLVDVDVQDQFSSSDGTLGFGLAVYGGASMDLQSCAIARNRGIGASASDPGTVLRLSDTGVADTDPLADGSGGFGLVAAGGASVAAFRSAVEGNRAVGVLAVGSGTSVHLWKTRVSGTDAGPDGVGGYGIQATGEAAIEMRRSSVTRNHGCGAMADGDGATLVLEDVSIAETRRNASMAVSPGVIAQNGAVVSAERLDVSDTEGPGLYAVSGGTLACDECALRDNAYAGAVVLMEGALALSDSIVEGTVGDANFGGGTGVLADGRLGSPVLDLRSSDVSSHPLVAVYLVGPGSYRLEGNSLAGGPATELAPGVLANGNAVFAMEGVTPWDEATESGLLLRENALSGSEGPALLLNDASAALDGNTWLGNAVDLAQENCGEGASPPPGYEEVGTAELCPAFDRVVIDLVSLDLDVPDVEPVE